MQINSITSDSFKGFYKIPNTHLHAEKLIYKFELPAIETDAETFIKSFSKNTIIPEIAKVYKALRGQEMISFEGSSPFAKNIWNALLKSVAESNHSSVEWLKMNAENFGIDISKFPGSESIIVISSDKDCVECLKYLRDKIYRLLPTPINSIKDLFEKQKINRNINSDLPEHLQIIERAKNFLEMEKNLFAQKVLNGKVKEVNEINQLLNRMMSE